MKSQGSFAKNVRILKKYDLLFECIRSYIWMNAILRDLDFSYIVEDRIVFALCWLVNEYPWSYTLSLTIAYFRENDRFVSNLTIVCFSRFQTLNRKIVYIPKNDPILSVWGSYTFNHDGISELYVWFLFFGDYNLNLTEFQRQNPRTL